MCLGVEGASVAFADRLKALTLGNGQSITKEGAGKEGDTYFVNYPIGTSQTRFLDMHLKKGATMDDRYSLRIYFFWDEQEQQVVVGWLPSHLETRVT
jgi:hypothetical protein